MTYDCLVHDSHREKGRPMTEAATTTPEVTGPPANLGEFEKMAWLRLAETIVKHNAEVSKLKAVSGDSSALMETLRNSDSDDPAIKSLQEADEAAYRAWEEARAKLDAALAPQVEAMRADVASQVEAITAAADEHYKTIKAGQNYLKGLANEDALKGLPEIVRVKSGSSGSGGGSGQRRIRGFDFYVNGNLATVRNAQGKESSNLAAAAKAIGVDTEALRGAFYQAMETQDAEKFKDTVKFGVKHNDTVYEVFCRKQVADTDEPQGTPATTEAAAS